MSILKKLLLQNNRPRWQLLGGAALGEGLPGAWNKGRASNFNTSRIDHLYQDPRESDRALFHYGDLTDSTI